MSVWLVVLWWYLAVGAVNYTAFAARGNSLFFHGQGRQLMAEGLVEAAFFVLLWPFQLLFWLVVVLNNVTGWILERIMG